ncbi:Dipeptidyl peptidase 4 [Thecaphora frezii]
MAWKTRSLPRLTPHITLAAVLGPQAAKDEAEREKGREREREIERERRDLFKPRSSSVARLATLPTLRRPLTSPRRFGTLLLPPFPPRQRSTLPLYPKPSSPQQSWARRRSPLPPWCASTMPRLYSDHHRNRHSIDSVATASDATLDSHHSDAAAPYCDHHPRHSHDGNHHANDNDNDYDDTDEGNLHLEPDEEQQVGLIQSQRNAASGTLTSPRSRSLFGSRGAAKQHRRSILNSGILVFVGVLVGFSLSIPLLYWLSSASSSPSFSSSVLTSEVHESASIGVHTSNATKLPASTNDAKGGWGLGRAPGFRINFQIPGWQTAAQAAAGTGLSSSKVANFKASGGKDLMPLDLNTVLGGTLRPQSEELAWLAEDPDEGVFSYVDWGQRDIWIEDVTHARKNKTGQGEVAPGGGHVLYVQGKDVRDHQQHKLAWSSYKVSPDMRWVMFFTNEEQQWRYSSHANVWLHNVAEKRTIAIGDGPSSPPTVAYAAWAPLRRKDAGAAVPETPGVAYVQDNNLFYIPTPGALPVKLTHDGAETVFNAVPDWVYEEEVFSADSALWFSPGGSKLVYLRFDETTVPVYEFPIYNPDKYRVGETTPYPEMTKMRYPKPGFPNPQVSVHMVDLDEIHDAVQRYGGAAVRSMSFVLASPGKAAGGAADGVAHDVDTLLADPEAAKQRLVTEVAWLNDDEVLVRETDRASDVMRIVHYELGKHGGAGSSSSGLGGSSAAVQLQGKVVRRQDARRDKAGWIRAAQTIEPLTHHNFSLRGSAYLDIVVSPLGYRHLALFESATAKAPVFLTEGRWEIDTLSHVDAKRRKAYFLAARPTPGERHLYSIDLPDWTSAAALARYRRQEPAALTKDTEPGYYGASFDPKGAYYVLNYRGPDVPYQKVLGVDDANWEMVLEDNSVLRRISSQYVRPQSVFYEVELNATMGDGSAAVASVKEVRPPNFDASGATRYPVLVQVYGGPDSQMVNARWDRAEWHQYLAASLGYVVCTIDARGTGMRGQAYRAEVARDLGEKESHDVDAAAHAIAQLSYVDEGRVGVWGWSYGGYLTNKVVERGSGTFSLAMSVAPVTKWEFYDSIYTERYLKLPATNEEGYERARVHVGKGHKTTPLLLVHGTGDDNVHFENSAHLVDLLTGEKVQGWKMRMFTDSRHGMEVRGAYRELYGEMGRWLVEKWGSGRG